jgi:predicted glutamine amidotransferase
MCRLLGQVSRTPVSVDAVLGGGRADFLELARKHGDGWGHAWAQDGPVQVVTSPESARTSAPFAQVAATRAATAWVTHLRWATLGLAVRTENTHPFTDDVIAFAHNGSIDPPSALDALVAPDLALARRGDTDSERMFLALRTRLRDRDEVTALTDTVADVVASAPAAHSLNCMVLTPTALMAVCSYDPGSEPDPDYYPLLYRTGPDGVVVTSTGWTDPSGWQVLGNGRLLVVDRSTLATSVHPVATPGTTRTAVA